MKKLTDGQIESRREFSVAQSDKLGADICDELLAIRADAETSKRWNDDVLDPLYDQMEAAGYTGTWTDKVRQACEAKKMVGDWMGTGNEFDRGA